MRHHKGCKATRRKAPSSNPDRRRCRAGPVLPTMSNSAVGNVYQTIIEEVINSSRVDFEESGVEEAVLEELRLVSHAIVPDFCGCPFHHPSSSRSIKEAPQATPASRWQHPRRKPKEEKTKDPAILCPRRRHALRNAWQTAWEGKQKPGVERSGGLGSGGSGGRHSTIWGPF